MSDEGRGLTKWQLALVVGTGAAAVVGLSILAYVALRSSNSGEQGTDNDPPPVDNPEAQAKVAEPASKSVLEQALELKQQGNNFFKQKKYEDAISRYEEGISLCPSDKKEEIAKFYQNIAAVYHMMAGTATDEGVKKGHLESVVANCSQALQCNHRYVKALTRRLKAYTSLGKKKDALLDVTRAIILDESQGAVLGEMVAGLLKDISQEQSSLRFPKLGPLAPTKHLVRTYLESFIWKDDLSEKALKEIWVRHRKSSAPQAQSEGKEESEEQKAESREQEGESDEQKEESEEQKEESGEQEGESEEQKDESEEQKEESLPDQSQGSEEVEQPPADPMSKEQDATLPPVEVQKEASPDPYDQFDKDPFVEAAAMFRAQNYLGIIEKLTEAVEGGCPLFVPHALLLRGTMYTLWRQPEAALKDFTQMINSEGVSTEMTINALIKKASVYAGNADMDVVRVCFDKCLALDPACPDALLHRARVNLEMGADPQALEGVVEDLKKTVRIVPQCGYAAFSLATVYHRLAGMGQSMQMLSQATRGFEEAYSKFPTFTDGMILYAMFLQDMNQFDKAEEILNKAVRMEPDNSTVHFSLGILCLVSRQETERSMACMEKAIATDNSCIQAYDTLASIEIQRGNVERALELYDKAVQFSRSQVEMGQALLAREVIAAQSSVCKEYGISMKELTSRAMTGIQ